MPYHEYLYIVLLVLTLAGMLMPEAHLPIVVCALLLGAIRKENSCTSR